MLVSYLQSLLGRQTDDDEPAASLDRVAEQETISDRLDHEGWTDQLPGDWSLRFAIEPGASDALEEVGLVEHPAVDWSVVVAPTSESTVTVNRRFPSGDEARLLSASAPEAGLAQLADRLPAQPATADTGPHRSQPTPSSPGSDDDDAGPQSRARSQPSRTTGTDSPKTSNRGRDDRDPDGVRAD